jgi:gliding motility-associated-like protein
MKVSCCKIIALLFICCFIPNFAHSQVVINEVMHYPSGAQGIISAGTEYVELFNTNPCTSANIGCWIIGIADVDGIANNRGSIVLPATASIPPLGHYVIGTTSSSADSNSIDFKTNRNTSRYCATGSFILANGDGWVGLYDASGIPVDALYWTVNASESSKITTDGDLDDSPCITTTASGCPAVASLLSPKNIFLTYPTRISYGGQYVNANTFSRIPDGGTWTRAVTPSINDLTVGNCNGGAGACIVPSGALRDTFDVSICNGQSYLFNGINRTSVGFYLDTFPRSGGCDSIAVLNLIIKPSRTGSLSASICPSSSYLFNGINRTTAGTYLDTLVGSNGCDSVLTLNLTIRPTSTGSISASICPGSTYLFNGINRNTAGAYMDTLVGSNGCDSVLTLNLSIRVRDSIIITQNLCAGSAYLFNGVIRNTSGTYLDTLINIYGCDSIATLILTIGAYSSGTINASICNGNSYLFNGINRTIAGSYNDTLLTSSGTCDSIVTLNLIVKMQTSGTINQSICAGSSYLFNGVNRTIAGAYLDTLIGSNGCDSFLTLNLNIRPISTGSISASICVGSSYLFNGVNRTTAGAYLDTLVGSNGCDSVLTLNLSIRPTTSGSISASICSGSSYLFNGVNRTTAGAYLDTLVGSNGCDSILTLNLSLLPTSNGTLSVFICEGSSYLFNGINVSIPGVYLDTFVGVNGCDSFLTLNLRNYLKDSTIITQNICTGSSYLFNGINRTASGIYKDTLTNRNGCDSLITLLLSVNNSDTTISNRTICIGEAINSIYYTNDTTVINNYTNRFGCDSFYQLNIVVYPLPTVNAGNDTTISAGNTAILIASGAANYSWNNATIGAVNSVSPSVSTTYIVTGTDANNCSNIDSVNVNIIPLDDSVYIVIPSAFTPNGDGLNDIYKILATKNLTLKSFTIFNRWGELVFSSNDISIGWDGRFKDREQPIGTFVYYIEALKISNKDNYNITGTVTLIR